MKSCTTLKPWLKPLFAGIYRGIESFQESLRGAKWISSIHSILVDMATGQKPVPPVNIPIPTKIGPKIGGEFTYQPKWDPIGCDPRPYFSQMWLPRSKRRPHLTFPSDPHPRASDLLHAGAVVPRPAQAHGVGGHRRGDGQGLERGEGGGGRGWGGGGRERGLKTGCPPYQHGHTRCI